MSGATSYDLYLSTASSPAFLKNVTTTSTTAGPLAGGTVHYWKVIAKNACGSGTASTIRSFTTATTPSVTTLTNGSPVTGLSGATGAWAHYKITVPSGQTSLAIAMSGGTGDADLYVKLGAQPTSTVYDYRPYLSGNAESVNVTNPAAGDWYISIYAYATYSGVSLTATYSGACTTPGTTTLSAPAAGATGVATSPTLSWGAVSGATSYDVYLSTASSPAFLRNVTTTSTTAGPLTAGTLYYWKVIAKNTCGSGAASTIRSFTTASGPTVTVLTNGVTVSSLSGTVGTWKHYKISVPTGQSSLVITQSGGTGDSDMYVKLNAQPTSTVYDYRPYLGGNNETVTVANPSPGDWYISLYAYAAYSGMSLNATYTAPAGCTSSGGTFTTSGSSLYQPSSSGYVSSVSGSHTGALTGPVGTDFDLYLEKLSGSTWSSVASGTGSSSTENVNYSGTSGTYRWRIHAYSGTGAYTLCTTKP